MESSGIDFFLLIIDYYITRLQNKILFSISRQLIPNHLRK
jgi:hypothetical protein